MSDTTTPAAYALNWQPPKQNAGIGAELESAGRSYIGLFGHVAGALGSDSARDWALEQDRKAEEASQRSGMTQSFGEVNGLGSAASYAGHLGIQMLPYLAEGALAGMTWGGSEAALIPARAAVAATARAGLSEAARDAAVRATARTGAVVASTLPSSTGQLLSAQQQESGEYNLPVALAEAPAFSALNAVGLEGAMARRALGGTLGASSRLGRVVGGAVRGAASQTVNQLGQGGLEEVARMSVNPDASLFSDESLSRLGERAAGGAFLGGAVGSVLHHGRRPGAPAADPTAPVDVLHPSTNDYTDLMGPAWSPEPASMADFYRFDPTAGMRGEDGMPPGGGLQLLSGGPWETHDIYAGMRGEDGALVQPGQQANLFHPEGDTPAAPQAPQAPQAPSLGQQGAPVTDATRGPLAERAAEGAQGQRVEDPNQRDALAETPSATVGTDFSLAQMRQRILAATGAHWGTSPEEATKSQAFAFAAALKISRLLQEGKPDQAAAHLQKLDEGVQTDEKLNSAGVAVRVATLKALERAVEDYHVKAEDARRQETTIQADLAKEKPKPGVKVDTTEPAGTATEQAMREANARAPAANVGGEPVGTEQSAEIMRERNAESELPNANVGSPHEIKAAIFNEASERAMKERSDILQRVLEDPATRNPVGRFRAELRKSGHLTLALTEDEARLIEHHEHLRDVFDPEIPAGPNEMDPNLVKERGPPGEPGSPKPVGEVQASRAAALDAAKEVLRKTRGKTAERIMGVAMRAFGNNHINEDGLRAVADLVARRKFGLAETMVKPWADREAGIIARDVPTITPAEAALRASQRALTDEPVAPAEPKPKRTRRKRATAEEPAPRTEEPAPRTEEPAPRTEEPAPRTEEPAPRTEEPAPRTEEPAPAETSTPAESHIEAMRRLADEHTAAVERGDKAAADEAARAIGEHAKAMTEAASTPAPEAPAPETPAPDTPAPRPKSTTTLAATPEMRLRQEIAGAVREGKISADKANYLRQLLKEDGHEAARGLFEQYLETRTGKKAGDHLPPVEDSSGQIITKLEKAGTSGGMGRRTLLRSGTLFSVFKLGKKVFSTTVSAQERMRAGDLPGAIGAIQRDSANPLLRELARRLAPLLDGVDLKTYEMGKDYPGGVPGELNQGSVGVTIHDKGTGQTTIHLRHDPESGFHGTTDQTLLHEAIHAALLSRFTNMTKTAANAWMNGAGTRVERALASIYGLQSSLRSFVENNKEAAALARDDNRPWLGEAVRDLHEFISYAMTHPDFQTWMKENNAGLTQSVWSRFKTAVKNFLGYDKPPAFLDDIMDATHALLEGARDIEPDRAGRRRVAATATEHEAPVVHAALASSEGMGEMMSKGRDIGTNLLGRGRRVLPKGLFLEHIVDHYGEAMPALKTYADTFFRSFARVNDIMTKADHTVRTWDAVKDPAMRQAVGDLMLDSTMKQVRPDRDRAHETNTLATPADHAALVKRYAALSPETQQIYQGVMNTFEQRYDEMQNLAKGIIKSSMLNDTDKSAAGREVENMFKRNKVYFPLSRDGNHIVIARTTAYDKAVAVAETARDQVEKLRAAKDTTPEAMKAAREAHALAVAAQEEIGLGKGGYTVQAFESEAKARAEALRLQQAGYQITRKVAFEHTRGVDVVPSGFMNKLNAVLDTEAARGGPHAQIAENLKSLMGQVYLQSLPENAALKRNIDRRGIAGYSTDARRAFAKASTRDAHLIARMELAEKGRQALAEMQLQAKAADQKIHDTDAGQPARYQEISNEILKRHAASLIFTDTPIQNRLAHAAFVWYLGFTPSFIVTNLAQTGLVSLPMMAARHGWGKSAGALAQAAREVGAAQIRAWKEDGRFGEVKVEHLSQDPAEQAALRDWIGRGDIDLTQEHDLGTIAAGESEKLRQFMRYAGYFPHYTEKFNRLTTALAAYRTAMAEKTANPAGRMDPVEYGRKLVADSHFNYSTPNTPLIMHPSVMPLARTMMQFKKYQLAMGYAMVNNFTQMIKGKSPEEKRIARRTFFGLLATHGIAAGVLGLPGAQLALGAANAMHGLFGDPDQPWDAQTAFREFLADVMGGLTGDPGVAKAAAEMVAHGALRAPGVRDVLPGDISGRTGLADLFNPVRTRDDLSFKRSIYNEYLAGLFGPIGSLGGDVVEGLGKLMSGDTQKGWELLLPKALRDISKAARFATEGVTSSKGNPIVGSDNISPGELVAQMMGFTPPNIAESYEGRASITNVQKGLAARSAQLLKTYSEAVTAHDQGAINDAREAIQQYNRTRLANHEPLLQGSAMARAVREQALMGYQMVNGVRLRPKQRALGTYGAYANTGQ